ILGRLQYRHLVAHLLCGMRKHAAELAAAHYAQPGFRLGGRKERSKFFIVAHAGKFIACAACVWRARNSCRRAASASSVPASMAIAVSAALAAPASPIANVETGMPLGICTIDSSESSPRRYLEGTGTPSTGTIVFAATMPGRCAAPPAPAIMARRPRDFADSA